MNTKCSISTYPQIRPLLACEGPQAREFIRAVLRKDFGEDGQLTDLLDINAAYHAQGGKIWAAFQHDTIVATVALLRVAPSVAILKRLFVDSAMRGTGLVSELCETVFDECHKTGTEGLYLTTMSWNERAVRFFKRIGFNLTQVYPETVVPGDDDTVMQKGF